MTRIIQPTEMSRPTVTPLGSSILDHADVTTNEGGWGWRNDAGLYDSYNCLDLWTPTPTCPDPRLTETGDFKEFETAEWQQGFVFGVYGGVKCNSVGTDVADQEAEVRRVFEANEGRGIERALKATRFVAHTMPVANAQNRNRLIEWDDTLDITPAGAVNVKQALALLEGYAASVYTGRPTLHLPRAVVSLCSDMIVWNGDKAYTPAGSKVAVGGGYDSLAMLQSGEWDMFASGEVTIEKSKGINVQQHVVPGDGAENKGLDPNDVFTMAERQYRVVVDCFTAKITATVFSNLA